MSGGAARLEGDRPDDFRHLVRERSRRQKARRDGEPVRRTRAAAATRGQARFFSARRQPDRGVGIHYTDEATIMKIIEPVVVAPLRREWEAVKAEIRALDERRGRARSQGGAEPAIGCGARPIRRFSRAARPLPGARPGLRLGKFFGPRVARAEGFRPRGARRCGRDEACRDDDFWVGPEAVQGHRDQRLRRRARAADGVDHRIAMAIAKGLGA